MSRRVLALAAVLLIAASPAVADDTLEGPGIPGAPRVLQSFDRGPPDIVAPPGASDSEREERSTEAAPSMPQEPQIRPTAVPSSTVAWPDFAEVAPVETSQLLWIIIALLAVVGLALSRLGRLKTAVGETFELEVQPQVQSNVEAALEAALSAQSGPVRTASGTANSTIAKAHVTGPLPNGQPVRFDVPLAVNDRRIRFGRR